MLELLRIIIALIGSSIAGAWDLKTSEIPDSLCAILLASGLVIALIQSFSASNPNYFILTIIATSIAAIIGAVLYYIGFWGGGDSFILAAIISLVPYMAIDFALNVFAIGAFYSIIYTIFLTLKDKKAKANLIKSLNKPVILSAIIFIILSISFIFIQNIFTMLGILLSSLPILYILTKNTESFLYKTIPSSGLKEGDMIAENIPEINIKKRLIKGLTSSQVEQIKNLKSSVRIKTGIKYGMVFPLSLVFTLVFGNFFLLFLNFLIYM